MFALLGTLNVLDFFVTVIALFVGKGVVKEQNGFFAGMLGDGNYLMVLIFKFMLMGLVMMYMFEKLRTAGKSYAMVRALFMLFVTLYILIVISNVLHLNFVGGILQW